MTHLKNGPGPWSPKQELPPRGGSLFWRALKDLNPRPTVLETAALPTELRTLAIPYALWPVQTLACAE